MTEDIKRLVRHLIPVIAIYAVNAGWLPAEAQADAIEAGIVICTLGLSLVWSKKRDVAK